MLTLVTRRMTEDGRERAEVQQITREVKIRDRAREGITKATIKVIRVVHDPRQHKAPLTSGRLTSVLLKTTFTLTV
jgi:hypothetical protein